MSGLDVLPPPSWSREKEGETDGEASSQETAGNLQVISDASAAKGDAREGDLPHDIVEDDESDDGGMPGLDVRPPPPWSRETDGDADGEASSQEAAGTLQEINDVSVVTGDVREGNLPHVIPLPPSDAGECELVDPVIERQGLPGATLQETGGNLQVASAGGEVANKRTDCRRIGDLERVKRARARFGGGGVRLSEAMLETWGR